MLRKKRVDDKAKVQENKIENIIGPKRTRYKLQNYGSHENYI